MMVRLKRKGGRSEWATATDLADASRTVTRFIREHGLPPEDWEGGEVQNDTGWRVAWVSWTGDSATAGRWSTSGCRCSPGRCARSGSGSP
jgi:hypothetical protein